METLNKQGVVDLLAVQAGTTKKEARKNLDNVLEAIKTALRDGKEVSLTGFGKFTPKVMPEEERFLALLGETRVIPERTVVRAKLSKSILN